MKLNLHVSDIPNPKNKCKGLFFRCRVNDYHDRGELLTQKITWRLLKKNSCSGCGYCQGFFEDIQAVDDLSCITFPKQPKDFAIYTPMFIPGQSDWETGYLDDWEWDFREVEVE